MISVLDMQEGDPYPQYPDDADVPQGQSEVAFRVKAATDIKALGNELYKKVQRRILCICLCCLIATLRGLWMACSIEVSYSCRYLHGTPSCPAYCTLTPPADYLRSPPAVFYLIFVISVIWSCNWLSIREG